MTRDIRPTQPDDLDDLSRFLTSGFHTDPEADFAAPEVLFWKFLEPRGEDEREDGETESLSRSYLAKDASGRIIGHVGICRTAFEGAAISGGRVATLHMIDWLGSTEHRSVGASLMRMAHKQAPTQFGLGGSEAGRSVIKRGGYQPREPVPVYQRVLRLSHWLRVPGLDLASRGARLARDLGRSLLIPSRARTAATAVILRRTEVFGDEIGLIVKEAKQHAIFTRRTPARLNHLLRFPRQAMTGWHLMAPPDRVCGFAILNVVPQHGGLVRLGKVVDLVLEGDDAAQWQAAAWALVRELDRQGADVAQAFAAPSWVAKAFEQAGFLNVFRLDLSIRDRAGLLPSDGRYHLTPLEADYAYT